MKLNNLKHLQQYRKQLRNEMTLAEVLLWKCLKSRKLAGTKFRRQHSIGNYIVDFYCAKYKLAIELDGEIHHDIAQSIYDGERDAILTSLGYRVVRFDNAAILHHIEGVLEQISCLTIEK